MIKGLQGIIILGTSAQHRIVKRQTFAYGGSSPHVDVALTADVFRCLHASIFTV